MKPDPPVNVTVEALEKAPQRLQVNWSYPSSWDPRFYWLRFQVRYRPEPAQNFTEVRTCLLACCLSLARLSPALCPLQVDQVTTTWLDIRDAWRGMRHVVQVRAKDEFGHGTWSEWSQEAVGTPWTGRRKSGGPETGGSPWGLPVSYSPLTMQTLGTSPLKWSLSALR